MTVAIAGSLVMSFCLNALSITLVRVDLAGSEPLWIYDVVWYHLSS